ncbi:MAG: DUF2510 domain-containing protein [Janthinobacterium lividum]
MSATAGWYPDPGGGQGLYRYWNGQAWSAATTVDPASAPPPQGIVNPGSAAGTAGATAHSNYGQGSYGQSSYGQSPYGQSSYGQSSYGQGSSAFGTSTAGGAGRNPYGQAVGTGQAPYAQYQKKRSGILWWVGAGALLLVLVVVAVFAIRAATGGGVAGGGGASGQDSSSACPPDRSDSPAGTAPPADGRVHGGPVSYPQLGSPWSAPKGEDRVPFGVNVLSQEVPVQANYDGKGGGWVASVLVGELQAGDGFFTPQQGSQIVVKCILGKFYGKNQVNSDVVVDKATTIDGHDAWVVESKLTFDIPGLQTKGERLIVAIVQAGTDRSGLFYASIPDTTPELLQPARDSLAGLKVDG